MFESDDQTNGREPHGEFTPAGGGAPALVGLESMPPGPQLAGLLNEMDPTEISDAYDLVEVAAACERLKAWVDAIGIRTAVALAGHPICHAPEAGRHGFGPVRAAGQLLAPRVGQSPTTASMRVGTAVQLLDELTDTVAALSRGDIDYQNAAALAVGVRSLDPPDGCADAVTGEPITPDGIRRALVAQVEARVLPKAGTRSLYQHREAIARAVARIAPRTADERHQHACDQRRVEFRSEADGMAWLSVYGPALDLTAVKVMLDAAAEATKAANPEDLRTLDQIRVDTLSALAWGILEDGQLPDFGYDPDEAPHDGAASEANATDRGADDIGSDAGEASDDDADAADRPASGFGSETKTPDAAATAGNCRDCGPNGGCGCGCGGPAASPDGLNRAERRARRRGLRLQRRHGRAAAVHVTVALSTLAGLDDLPAELDGCGPITAEVARRFAAHATWRRLLTDPASGALLDYGTTRYAPPADLVEHVHARDGSCRFPTCARPARLCQFDHTIAAGAADWSTSAGNGGPLSAGCHNAKTHAGWRLEQPRPGQFVWTAPTGHTYGVDPEMVGPLILPPPPEPPIDEFDPGPAFDIPDPDPPPF
jgi:Domain of unknown function (DUF222)